MKGTVMIRSFRQLNKENSVQTLSDDRCVQSFAQQTIALISYITFFDRKESYELLNYWQFSHLHSFIFPYRECSLISMTSQERVTAYAFTLAKIRKKLSERNSIRTKIVTLDLSPTNSRCSNHVGLFAVSRTFLAHSVMLGGVNVVDWAFSATTGCNAQREHNIICHAELVSASNEPEIPKQVRNDKKSEMRGAAHVDKQPGEFLRANRCYLQGFQYIYPGGRVW